MNFDEWNHAVEDCSICYAEVKAQYFSAHLDWHKVQTKTTENVIQAIEGITRILEKVSGHGE